MSHDSDSKQQAKDEAKATRKSAEVERGLRQFLTIETGQGKSPAYLRGHEFNFDFTQAQRDRVFSLMNDGMSFDDAFAFVKGIVESEPGA